MGNIGHRLYHYVKIPKSGGAIKSTIFTKAYFISLVFFFHVFFQYFYFKTNKVALSTSPDRKPKIKKIF